MNDPYFSGREMLEGTEQAEAIYNELPPRIHAAFGRIQSRIVTTPPGSPNEYDAYIVPTGGLGAWAGLDGNIVIFLDDWLVMPIKSGMKVYILDENMHVEFITDGGVSGAATSGQQILVPVFVTGAWRIQGWDALNGNMAFATLNANTILMATTNMQPGRRYVLRVQQDGTGGWTLSSELGEFAGVAGTTIIDVDTSPNAVTDVIIQGPSAPFSKPAIYETIEDLRISAP